VHFPVLERRLLRSSHPNRLLAGDRAATDAALAELGSSLRAPVTTWSPDEPLVLPSTAMGTLVLRDVDCLKPVEQVQLLEWLQQNDFALQVVASTSVPLLPRVATGAFLDSLYYRLNVLYLDLAA
jgi:transcriptional regulator of acetoin/glycerol metabolism